MRSAVASLVAASALGGALAAPADPALHLMPKYGIPGYETKWSITPEGEREKAKESSRDTDIDAWKQLRKGNADGAMRRFNAAWSFWPENPNPIWGMAIYIFEKTLKADGTKPETALVGFDTAIVLATEAHGLRPNHPPLLTDIALMHASRGAFRKHLGREDADDDFRTAEVALTNAGTLQGEHPKIESTWATLERYRGNLEKAEQHAAKAEELDAALAAEPAAQASEAGGPDPGGGGGGGGAGDPDPGDREQP